MIPNLVSLHKVKNLGKREFCQHLVLEREKIKKKKKYSLPSVLRCKTLKYFMPFLALL